MLSTETATTVELRGLCKRFKKRDVLIDINLKVSSGETVCVLGTGGLENQPCYAVSIG